MHPSITNRKNTLSRIKPSHQRGTLPLRYLYGLSIRVFRYLKLLHGIRAMVRALLFRISILAIDNIDLAWMMFFKN